MTTETHVPDHRPTEDFRDYLEDLLVRTARRHRLAGLARIAVVAIVSVGIGATATLASAQVRKESQRSELLEAARADAALAAMRLDVVRGQLDLERRRAAAGGTTPASLDAVEVRSKELEAEVVRARLNIAEIEAASLPPRDEINAPLVNGRDFVSERLQLQLAVAQAHLEAADRAVEEVGRKVRVGAVAELELAAPQLDVARARRDFTMLAERLQARRAFLEKGTSVEVLTQRLQRIEIQQEVVVAERALQIARSTVALLEKRVAVGADAELDLLSAKVTLKERELELARLSKRLREMPGREDPQTLAP